MRIPRTHVARLAAVGALTLALGACADDDDPAVDVTGTGDTTADTTADTAADAGDAPVVVPAGTTAWNPASVQVGVGDSVTWQIETGVPHSVKSVGDGPLDSGSPTDSGDYTHTFTEAGTYDYVCGVHPSMQGTVVVT